MIPVPVQMPKVGELFIAPFEAAYLAAEQQGHRATSILLTNPNNPTGTIYGMIIISFSEHSVNIQ